MYILQWMYYCALVSYVSFVWRSEWPDQIFYLYFHGNSKKDSAWNISKTEMQQIEKILARMFVCKNILLAAVKHKTFNLFHENVRIFFKINFLNINFNYFWIYFSQ
jgi:hypothetical protein